MNIHKEILRLSVPAIVTNITIPILGLIDITISGHIGKASEIGAIALGAMMFNMLYWNFTFLRMGTTGITAQFFGERRHDMMSLTLFRAFFIAMSMGVAILLLQYPLNKLLLLVLSPSDKVSALASSYYYICIWGAPALLCTNAIKGWYIGMQNSRFTMYIAVSMNVVNVVMSLLSVFCFGFGFVGIAVGTLIAQYFGLAMSLALLVGKYRKYLDFSLVKRIFSGDGVGKFFRVNSDIFLRSICLLTVTAFFTSAGARSGDLTLAVNALIMQLFLMFTYFMDGFAYAGEALVGKYFGACNPAMLRKSIWALFLWGGGVMCLFCLAYGGGLRFIFEMLTSDSSVVDRALDFRLWCFLIPVAGVSTFIWDGVFVGLTATRQLVCSVFLASLLFFAIYLNPVFRQSNDLLWISFLCYIAMRGFVLHLLYLRMRVKSKC